MNLKIVCFLTVLSLIQPQLLGQTEQNPERIMEAAFQKTIEEDLIKNSLFSYAETTIEEIFDDDGKIKSRKTDSHQINPKTDPPKLNDGEIYRPEIEEILKPGRYIYSLDYLRNNQHQTVILFHPKKDGQPQSEKNGLRPDVTNEILNNLEGEIFIDPKSTSIVAVNARLYRSPLRGIKIFGVVYRFDLTLERRPLPELSSRAPTRFELTTEYSFSMGIFKSIKRFCVFYENYTFSPR